MDLLVPDPVSTVPAGKFGQVADVSTKLTADVSMVGLSLAATRLAKLSASEGRLI